MKKIIAFLALSSAFVAPSFADVIYTSRASFMDQVQDGAFTRRFNAIIDTAPTSRNYSNGTYSYTAYSSGGLYSNGEFLGANLPNTDLVIYFTGASVNALGANFYNTNANDGFTMAAITITLSDGTTTTFQPSATTNSYRGFTTDVFITSLTISNTNVNRYVGLDNLTVGRAIEVAAVPEPASLAVMGAGMFGLMAMRRRRKG
jgi:hypothetical protein